MESFPFIIMHTDLLTCTSKSKFRVIDYRLNVAKASKEDRENFHDASSTAVSEGVAVSFFLRLLKRMVYGIFMGCNKPDPMAQIEKKFRVLNFPSVD